MLLQFCLLQTSKEIDLEVNEVKVNILKASSLTIWWAGLSILVF
jgi:hypothetical protein